MKRWILSSCTVSLLTWLTWNAVAADEGQAVVQPTQVEFYGTVRDEAGNGVATCQVTFSAPWRETWERLGFNRYRQHEEAPTFVITTDAQGSYRASIDVADPRWLGPGEGAIVAFSPSAGLAVEAYRLERGLVDLPLDLTLAKRSTASIVLQDETGTPIAGARITPVCYGEVAMPSQLGAPFAVTTDASGKADIIRSPFELSAVLVETAGELAEPAQNAGETTSYLTLQPAGDGTQVATLPRPLESRLRIQHLDPVQTAHLPEIAWTIVSYRQIRDSYDATWQTLRTATGETTATINLPSGSLHIITDAESGHGLFSSYGQSSETLSAELNEVLAVLEPGQRVTGSVVSAKDSSPIPGITLQHHGNSHVLSQADGSFAA